MDSVFQGRNLRVAGPMAIAAYGHKESIEMKPFLHNTVKILAHKLFLNPEVDR
jgi:hypothetical protein